MHKTEGDSEPNRDRILLACKTNKRDRTSAEKELMESMELLHTDHFDVYQLHGISSMDDVEGILLTRGMEKAR